MLLVLVLLAALAAILIPKFSGRTQASSTAGRGETATARRAGATFPHVSATACSARKRWPSGGETAKTARSESPPTGLSFFGRKGGPAAEEPNRDRDSQPARRPEG